MAKKAPGFAHKSSKQDLNLNAWAILGGSADLMCFAQKTGVILQICGKTFLAFETSYKSFIFNALCDRLHALYTAAFESALWQFSRAPVPQVAFSYKIRA